MRRSIFAEPILSVLKDSEPLTVQDLQMNIQKKLPRETFDHLFKNRGLYNAIMSGLRSLDREGKIDVSVSKIHIGRNLKYVIKYSVKPIQSVLSQRMREYAMRSTLIEGVKLRIYSKSLNKEDFSLKKEFPYSPFWDLEAFQSIESDPKEYENADPLSKMAFHIYEALEIFDDYITKTVSQKEAISSPFKRRYERFDREWSYWTFLKCRSHAFERTKKSFTSYSRSDTEIQEALKTALNRMVPVRLFKNMDISQKLKEIGKLPLGSIPAELMRFFLENQSNISDWDQAQMHEEELWNIPLCLWERRQFQRLKKDSKVYNEIRDSFLDRVQSAEDDFMLIASMKPFEQTDLEESIRRAIGRSVSKQRIVIQRIILDQTKELDDRCYEVLNFLKIWPKEGISIRSLVLTTHWKHELVAVPFEVFCLQTFVQALCAAKDATGTRDLTQLLEEQMQQNASPSFYASMGPDVISTMRRANSKLI